jgi:hypothetical protein
MGDEMKVPKMMVLLLGDAPEPFRPGIYSARLMRWCEAFDEWLEDRRRNYRPGAYKQALLTWKRFLAGEAWTRGNASGADSTRQRKVLKMPWEIEQADIEGHVSWMRAKGYASTTMANAVGVLASFYRWCGERGVDPECGAGFNPAAGVRRPKVRRYAGADLLSRGEVEALLGFMRRDETPLGRRDYAFTLARLRLGVPLSNLRLWRWGQIEQDEQGVWVRWRESGERQALPGEVWEAVAAWLRASGRLEGIREDEYIFTPLRYPGRAETGDKAEDWLLGQPLSSAQLLSNLKLYGRIVGIGEEKLTLMALRRTAVRLRLDEEEARWGERLRGMQTFMDSEEEAKLARYRLKFLPHLPQGDEPGEEGGSHAKLPQRMARPFQEGEGMTHGMFAHRQPPEEVKKVLEEDIQGIDEELAGMRELGGVLLEMQAAKRSSKEARELADAYTRTTMRLAAMIEAEDNMKRREKEDEGEGDLREWLEQLMIRMGSDPAELEAEFSQWLDAASRRLEEEIAGTRLVLRRTLGLAREARLKADPEDLVRSVDVYSSGCSRLMRLLRVEAAGGERLEVYFREVVQEVLREVLEEKGLGG